MVEEPNYGFNRKSIEIDVQKDEKMFGVALTGETDDGREFAVAGYSATLVDSIRRIVNDVEHYEHSGETPDERAEGKITTKMKCIHPNNTKRLG